MTSKTRFFLNSKLQDFPSMETLNSFLAQSAGELWSSAKMVKVNFGMACVFTQFVVFEP